MTYLPAKGKIPPPIQPGDTIALISPSGSIPDDSLKDATTFLTNAGYRVDIGRNAYHKADYLAGSDKNRFDDIDRALQSNEIKAVICSRGGYGSQRLLDFFNWDALSSLPPKLFIGFSDLGAFQTPLWLKSNWVSFSGLQAASGFSGQVQSKGFQQFLDTLSGNWRGRLKWNDQESVTLEPVEPGSCEGLFLPICLSILVSLIGTPYLNKLDGVILCVEDIGEAPYRIDRLFWQLGNSGFCDSLSGIVLGSFIYGKTNITDKAVDSALLHLGKFHYPIWQRIPYGHFPDRLTLPLGVQANIGTNGSVLFE